MGAIIFNKKKVVSKGYNVACKYVHPSELPLKYRKYPTSIHAEMSAIISARQEIKGCSIIVVRTNLQGKLMEAFPCQYCMPYLKHVGIRRIYYSTEEGMKEYTL